VRSFASGWDVSDVTSSSSAAARPSSGEGAVLESLQHQRLLSCRSRSRVASALPSFARRRARIRLRSHHVAAFWARTLSMSSHDLAVDRVPARSYRRSLLTTSLVRRSRRARSPPPRVFLPRRRPARWLGLPGARGSGPAATPVLSTDVCSSRILFSKTIAPRLGARRIAMFPRDARACGFTPQRSLR
jgi:hypothetical protein